MMNETMHPPHHRMPVILPDDVIDDGLDPEADPASLQLMLQPRAEELLDVYPVSNAVNNPQDQGPELILPA